MYTNIHPHRWRRKENPPARSPSTPQTLPQIGTKRSDVVFDVLNGILPSAVVQLLVTYAPDCPLEDPEFARRCGLQLWLDASDTTTMDVGPAGEVKSNNPIL
jgi:hypothetical protein